MKCEEVIELMHRELDGDLNPKEHQGLLTHLASCPDCHTLFDQLKALSFQLESLPKVTPAYSIVDKVLPILDKQPNKSVIKKSKKLWIPGLALAATFFIALLISNSTSDMDQTSQYSVSDQSAEIFGVSGMEEKSVEADNGYPKLVGAPEGDGGGEEISSSGIDEPSSGEAGDTSSTFASESAEKSEPNEQVKVENREETSEAENEEEIQTPSIDFASLDEDYVEYNSPDGVYSAYEGFGNEDIRIKKEDRPYYMTKNQNQWEKPWEVISIEWISNNELYYVLYQPEEDEEQYWMLYTDERTEEQLEEPYVAEVE